MASRLIAGLSLSFALAFTASCSRDNPFEARVKNLPRRFQISEKAYLLNEQEPGEIEDDAIVYTADGGARPFNLKTRTVLRRFYLLLGRELARKWYGVAPVARICTEIW